MPIRTDSVVQFSLPFEGMRDRVRALAQADLVVPTGKALRAMQDHDISDLLVIRALRKCELVGKAKKGSSRGEWQCMVKFEAKGFRQAGRAQLTIGRGRAFVENIDWEPQP